MKTKLKEKKVVEATPESKVAEISKEIVKVEKEAKGIVVKTQADYEEASKFLSGVVKPRVNRINELVKFFTDPFVEARRIALTHKQEIEDMFAKQVNALNKVELDVKGAMKIYLNEQDAIARKEEERLAKLREKQNEKREEKGQEVIATPLPVIARADTTIRNEEGGKTTAKKVWKFQIEEYSKLPQFIIDEVLYQAKEDGITEKVVRKFVNRGERSITGCRIWEDFDISATASK